MKENEVGLRARLGDEKLTACPSCMAASDYKKNMLLNPMIIFRIPRVYLSLMAIFASSNCRGISRDLPNNCER